jgi:hypothetical protein
MLDDQQYDRPKDVKQDEHREEQIFADPMSEKKNNYENQVLCKSSRP